MSTGIKIKILINITLTNNNNQGMRGQDSECYQCPAGYTSINAGSTNCIICPGGSFTFTSGSSMCYQCPAGFYSSSTHTECIKCDEGKSSQKGSSFCT